MTCTSAPERFTCLAEDRRRIAVERLQSRILDDSLRLLTRERVLSMSHMMHMRIPIRLSIHTMLSLRVAAWTKIVMVAKGSPH